MSINKITECIAEEFSRTTNLGDEQKENLLSNNFSFTQINQADNIYEVKGLPISLEAGGLYVLIAWNTNCKLEGLGENAFKVLDHRGPPLDVLNSYIIVYQS